mmetsp:Transcript_240/g.394  ORF Transcript_240/g.394 Transcript_240/m.394 type:complete len:80 (+) Transcript_240:185-424(+)
MSEKKVDTGTDPKSLAINLATILLFLLPFAVYLDEELTWRYVAIVGGAFAFTLIVPPVGWTRPHPYSDWPRNKPIGTKD